MARPRLGLLLLLSLGGYLAHARHDDDTSSTTTDSSSSSSSSSMGIIVLTGTKTTSQVVTHASSSSDTDTLASTTLISGTATTSDNDTETETGTSGTGTGTGTGTETVTYITGTGTATGTVTGTLTGGNFSTTSTTSTSTSSAPTVTNTQPCNLYVELCERQYSNITHVACHNSPFVRAGNAAANQQYDVTAQLDDGVRLLQAQIQWPANDTAPHFCHTTCDILDAGPITDWLATVARWVAAHRFDVVTILLGNGNYSSPDKYAPYIQASGILDYVYTPPHAPMNLSTWPTLAEMIIANQRVVFFLDYEANQTAYPWLQDEFSNLWETPFDPTDRSFPCTVGRPPNLAAQAADRQLLYLMNHNLNAEISLLGTKVLVPAVSELNATNAAGTGYGSLGLAADNCRAAHGGRAPNFLDVDYYNYGSYPGSVFEVAALMNNVSFNNRSCCGPGASGAGRTAVAAPFWLLVWAPLMVGFAASGLLLG